MCTYYPIQDDETLITVKPWPCLLTPGMGLGERALPEDGCKAHGVLVCGAATS